MKRSFVILAAIVATALAVWFVALRPPGEQRAEAQSTVPPAPYYVCYSFNNGATSAATPLVRTQFGDQTITVGLGLDLCAPALKGGNGDPNATPLRCHAASGSAVNAPVSITTQYGVQAFTVLSPQLLCVPAVQQAPPPPGPPVPPVKPTQPYYLCYGVSPDNPQVTSVNVVTKVTNGTINLLANSGQYCAPAIKNGAGDLNAPPLRCWGAVFSSGIPGFVVVRIWTQFNQPEPDTDLEVVRRFCVPVKKFVPPPTATPTQTPTATATSTVTPTATATLPVKQLPTAPYYVCYYFSNTAVSSSVTVTTQLGTQGVSGGAGAQLCAPTLKGVNGNLNAPPLRCHVTTGTAVNAPITVTTQFGVAAFTVGSPGMLCVPAVQQAPPGTQPLVKPAEPRYVCYEVGAAQQFTVNIQTKVTTGTLVNHPFLPGALYCLPALKNGAGNLAVPPLLCLSADLSAGTTSNLLVRIWTQFNQPEPDTTLDGANISTFCVPVTKDVPKQAEPGDTDGDGCSDQRENGTNAMTGGRRNYRNPNDFFDVFGQMQSLVKDKNIDVPNDILPVVLAYGQGPNDPGQGGIPGPLYLTRKDRGPAKGGAMFAWQRTGPDGRIEVPNDILPVILQYNHSCK